MSLKRFIIPVTIALVISSFSLWLLEHPIKYFFFIVQFVLTTTLVWIFMFPQSSFIPKVILTNQDSSIGSRLLVSRLDCLFLFLSLSLFFANIFNVFTPINILLAFVVVSLLPGYVLLRLIDVFFSISYFEALILSYVLSLALSGFLPTIFMPIMNQNNKLMFLGLLTFLSVLPIFKDLVTRRAVFKRKMKLEFSFIQLLMFTLIVGFFSIIMLSLYPQLSHAPGFDIVRNLSNARLWGLSPDLFSSIYPFFHIYLSATYSV